MPDTTLGVSGFKVTRQGHCPHVAHSLANTDVRINATSDAMKGQEEPHRERDQPLLETQGKLHL